MEELIASLKQNFKGDILNDAATLEQKSRDASLFKIKPQLVVFPKDADDLKYLITTVTEANKKLPAERHYSLTARSAGTDMTGGPLTESIVVDFTKYFTHIKEV